MVIGEGSKNESWSRRGRGNYRSLRQSDLAFPRILWCTGHAIDGYPPINRFSSACSSPHRPWPNRSHSSRPTPYTPVEMVRRHGGFSCERKMFLLKPGQAHPNGRMNDCGDGGAGVSPASVTTSIHNDGRPATHGGFLQIPNQFKVMC